MARINQVDWRAPTLSPSAVRIVGGQFIESEGTAAGTYTLDFFLPAFAPVLDVLVHSDTLWTAGTSAKMNVGFWSVADGEISTVIDVDDIFTDIDLKATDLLVTESVSLNRGGGLEGDMTGVVATQLHGIDVVDDVDRFVRFTLTTVGTVGTAGVTYVYLMYGVPEMDAVTFTAT